MTFRGEGVKCTIIRWKRSTAMKLKDTGLTKEQLIEKANKYLIDTAARFDLIQTVMNTLISLLVLL